MSREPKDKLAELAFCAFFIGSFIAAMISALPALILFGAGPFVMYLWGRFGSKKSRKEEQDKVGQSDPTQIAARKKARKERDEKLARYMAEYESKLNEPPPEKRE